MTRPKVILSIAGFDPSSGAGITADVKTAAALNCYAATCITALTVQSTRGVFAVEPVRPEVVRRTLEELADDLEISAVRIGMLGSAAVASVVADLLQARQLPHIVIDPVTRSSSGTDLLDDAGLDVLRSRLLPMAEVITPNIEEAAELAEIGHLHPGIHWEAALLWLTRAADKLHQRGARNVVITGGHLAEPNDLLSQKYEDHVAISVYPGSKIETHATHGTGCAFATAIACHLAQSDHAPRLARRGVPWAVEQSKTFVREAMLAARPLGHGNGPVNHLYAVAKNR